jgi:hypothetical protein
VAEIFVQLVHRLETNTINSLWANWIRAAQRLLGIHHPEMNAQEREKHFEKIMRGECSDPLLPLLPLSAEHVRKAIAFVAVFVTVPPQKSYSQLFDKKPGLFALSLRHLNLCLLARGKPVRDMYRVSPQHDSYASFLCTHFNHCACVSPPHPLPTYLPSLQKHRWCTFGD